MKHEFKIKKSKDQTVYTLESASVGASSTAGGATVTKTLGGVRRRDNLLAQEGDSIKVPVKQKPRQGPLRPQTGAGAHKDKKKAQKQGQEKHRKPYMEELKDKIESLKSQLEENDLARQMLALAKSKGMNARIAGTPEQERERTQQMLAQRAKERDAASAQTASDDAKNLPQLKAEYEEMKKKYEALGGSNWQYADREQNLSSAEREARSMEPALRNLSAKIARAEKAGVAEGFEPPLVPGGRWNYSGHQIIANNKTPNGSFLVLKNKNDGKYEIHKQVGSRTPGGLEFVGAYTTPEETEAAFKKISGGVEIGVTEGSSFQTDQMVSHISQIIRDIYPRGGDKNTYMKLVAREMRPIVQSNPKLFRRAFGIAYDNVFHIDQDDDFDYTDYSMRQGEKGVAEGLPQTLRKVVPGYAKREIDKKMDAGKFGKTDADKDANFYRYKKIQDKLKEQGVAEGAEFGAYYYEQLAQQTFDINPNLQDENEILNLGYKIAKGELGSRAQGMFRDEDFPSDFVSAYSYLQKQGVAEGSNPEYDDEAGMADNNLETLKRAVVGLDELINAGDNLPEWCQEKIAVAKSMLVAVWDYMQSEEHDVAEDGNIAEDTIRPKLAAALKELGFKGPFKLGQLPEWMKELQDGRFDENTSIMIGGDDPDYDPWVAKGYDYGYAYGMEIGYQTGLSAQEVFNQAKADISGLQGVSEHKDMCHVCGQTPCNCTTISEYESKLKEMLDLKLAEKIPPNASVDYYIQDFSKSNAPQFRGKTKEKRKQMAIAAYYGSKQPKKKKK